MERKVPIVNIHKHRIKERFEKRSNVLEVAVNIDFINLLYTKCPVLTANSNTMGPFFFGYIYRLRLNGLRQLMPRFSLTLKLL